MLSLLLVSQMICRSHLSSVLTTVCARCVSGGLYQTTPTIVRFRSGHHRCVTGCNAATVRSSPYPIHPEARAIVAAMSQGHASTDSVRFRAALGSQTGLPATVVVFCQASARTINVKVRAISAQRHVTVARALMDSARFRAAPVVVFATFV